MDSFSAPIGIIDGNPFVLLPVSVLNALFEAAKRTKGPIPVRGCVNGRSYRQTLVKFAGEWRLYINMKMLDDSPRRVGEVVDVQIEFDVSDRSIVPHPKLLAALAENEKAREAFESLSPSGQKEIVRYIDQLKQESSVERNVGRAVNFLLGKCSFVGRDHP